MLLVGTAVVLFVLDWRLALATLAVIPLMALATVWFRIRSNRAYRRVRERIGLVTATLAEDISGMRVVQSYAREPRNQSSFRGINTRYREANYETIVLNGLYFPAVDFLSSLATAIVLGYGGYLLLDDQVSVGTLLAFFLYLANFFDPVQQLSQLYNTFLSATAALDKIMEVLDEEPEIVDAPARARAAPDRRARALRGRPLRVRVAPRGAARDRSRRPRGDVGRARRRDRCGQVDDREADRALLRRPRGADHDRRPRSPGGRAGVAAPAARRRAAGGVPVRGHGRGEHRLRAARRDRARTSSGPPRAVGADGWIRELENGYDTELGERGFRLSLGQRQLVAFARALLADPRILILDEATSSVDIGTERVIEAGAAAAPRGADGVRDRAPALDDPGRRPHRRPLPRPIVEQGTHAELMARGGAYTGLYGDWAERVA